MSESLNTQNIQAFVVQIDKFTENNNTNKKMH